MKLTAREVQTAKPEKKDYKLSDGGGLYLLVKSNGTKCWRLKYRFAGKEKLLAIGVYPDLKLADARERRDAARRYLVDGVDPGIVKKEERQALIAPTANSFENIAREWYKRKYDHWSVSYRTEMMITFEKDVFPHIGHRPIADIKPLELLDVLTKLERRGANEKMRKVRQRCGEVFRYAIVTGRAEYNPSPDLAGAIAPHKQKHYPFLTAEEIPEFLKALSAYRGSHTVKIATRLLMLTAVRTAELRMAEWCEFNFDTAIWEVPQERMKMRRPHVVPLARQVLVLLEELKTITGRFNLLFPSRLDDNKPMSNMAITVLIRRIGFGGRATGHGFRHTMSTILHERDFNTDWIELQLGHLDKNKIRGVYNHAQYLKGRKEMMQWYADYIEKAEKYSNKIGLAKA